MTALRESLKSFIHSSLQEYRLWGMDWNPNSAIFYHLGQVTQALCAVVSSLVKGS